MFIENERVDRKVGRQTLDALMRVDPSTLGHMTDLGFIRGLEPITRPMRMVGPAVTVRIPHLDSTAVHCALDLVEPGDVIVIDQSGDEMHACWGGVASYAASKRGVGGVVVDGGVTDYSDVIALGLPVFSRSITALTTRIMGMEGAINVPVTVGSVTVKPGDIVFGNEDGVAVLDPEDAERTAILLAEREAKEAALKSRLDAGESLASLTSARALFEERRAGAA